MEHLSNNHEDHPNQHQNSHKLCNETGHPLLAATGSLSTKSFARFKYNFLHNSEGQMLVPIFAFRQTSEGDLFHGRPNCLSIFKGSTAFCSSFSSK